MEIPTEILPSLHCTLLSQLANWANWTVMLAKCFIFSLHNKIKKVEIEKYF